MLRIPYEQMYAEFLRVLSKFGFSRERAEACARMFAETSRDGVYSHGLNRFPRFIEYIQKGFIDVHASPEKVSSFGVVERWEGHAGPGNLNAAFCMDRAIELSRENGMGCVALGNTNHWMRAGTYGWQAAEAGCIGICWTNTTPNLPPWGASECKLGNNPIVLSIPRKEGPIVLDMAMSMYSYGKLESYSLQGEFLPIDGGFDTEGNLTRDPKAILESRRPLPIGYWKGAGLSLLLDLITVVLSGGNSTYEIGKIQSERSLSQTFIAIDTTKLPEQNSIHRAVNEVVEDLHRATPAQEKGKIYYPGERTLLTRKENLELGIPADPSYWNRVLEM